MCSSRWQIPPLKPSSRIENICTKYFACRWQNFTRIMPALSARIPNGASRARGSCDQAFRFVCLLSWFTACRKVCLTLRNLCISSWLKTSATRFAIPRWICLKVRCRQDNFHFRNVAADKRTSYPVGKAIKCLLMNNYFLMAAFIWIIQCIMLLLEVVTTIAVTKEHSAINVTFFCRAKT